jgi:predicted dehydrogenase
LAIKFPKLRVAVAGTSFGGHVQIPVFQSHPRTEVVAVSSGRAERAEKIAKEQGIPAHYTDFEEMLDKEKPDLVSIVTPPEFHFPMTMAVLNRRIHTLCEKPFALSFDEAKQMKLVADDTPVVAMIDYEFRFLPGRAYAEELLRQKYVGEIRMAHIISQFGWRARAEDAGWDWWADASKGGGALGALGSHAVDSLWLIMGPPRRILCDLATFVPERNGRPVTSDDAYTMLIEFQSGARAVVQMTSAAGLNSSHFGIYGSEGELFIPNLFATELRGGKRGDRASAPIAIPEKYKLAPEEHPLRAPFRVLLSRMIQAIDNRLPSPTPNFDDAVKSQIVLDAARESARQGTWVEVTTT